MGATHTNTPDHGQADNANAASNVRNGAGSPPVLTLELAEEVLRGRLVRSALGDLRTVFVAIGTIVAAALVLVGTTYKGALDRVKADVNNSKMEVDKVKAGLEAQLTDVKSQKDALELSIRDANHSLANSKNDIQDLQGALSSAEHTGGQLDRQQTDADTAWMAKNVAIDTVLNKMESSLKANEKQVTDAVTAMSTSLNGLSSKVNDDLTKGENALDLQQKTIQARLQVLDTVAKHVLQTGLFVFSEKTPDNIVAMPPGQPSLSLTVLLGEITHKNREVSNVTVKNAANETRCNRDKVFAGQTLLFSNSGYNYYLTVRNTAVTSLVGKSNEIAFLEIGWEPATNQPYEGPCKVGQPFW